MDNSNSKKHPLSNTHLHFWAKANANTGAWHPVLYHMLDVANVARVIYKRITPGKIRGDISRALSLDANHCSKLISLFAGIHDIGKISPDFQSKRKDLYKSLVPVEFRKGLILMTSEQHHTRWGLTILDELFNELSDSRPDKTILNSLINISMAHHGDFLKSLKKKKLKGLLLETTERWKCAHKEHLNAIISILELDSLNNVCSFLSNIKTIPAGLALYLTGLISISDWIGSNEDFFPYDQTTNIEEYQEISRRRADDALTSIGWLPVFKPGQSLADFNSLFTQFKANSLQQKVEQSLSNISSQFLLIIEDAMGGGKTEAAFYALQVALGKKLNSGAYIAMPTQATSNAMFSRFRAFLEQRNYSGNLNLQLAHGNALLTDLMSFSSMDGDYKNSDSSVSAQSWFLPSKRTLLTPFGVGTIDQSLLSVLYSKHWFIRLFGLANKVVIFDEVHAYDTYMTTILQRLVAWLKQLGCSIIMLSATLPQQTKITLLEHFSSDHNARASVPVLKEYPRITLYENSTFTEYSVSKTAQHEKSIALDWLAPEKSVEQAIAISSQGQCVCIIHNTVDRAQQTFKKLQQRASDDIELYLFHARFPFSLRKSTEQLVLDKFGKNGNRPQKAILVATQVVEQSLDLDFDYMISDLAPVDLLLQRLGRLHRHNLKRNHNIQPLFSILLDNKQSQPLKNAVDNTYIYSKYVTARTYLSLENKSYIQLPSEIDILVQKVYSDQQLTDNSDLIKFLNSLKEEDNKQQKKDADTAHDLIIQSPEITTESIIANYKAQVADGEDPAISGKYRAATRLGEPGITVVCLFEHEHNLLQTVCDNEVNLSNIPDKKTAKDLINSSLSISLKRLREPLLELETPSAWRKSSALRYAKPLVFRNNHCTVTSDKSSITVTFDKLHGLVVEHK